MLLSLGGTAIVAAAVLGFVNTITADPIADAAQKTRIEAMAEVLPAFDNDVAATAQSTADGFTIYTATLGGKPAGTAVESYSDAGFGGRIIVLTGFDTQGCITGYRVLEHAETPGLGAKAGEWFAAPGHDIRGSKSALKVKADGGDIDAITGSTITSRAFFEAVNNARKALETDKNASK